MRRTTHRHPISGRKLYAVRGKDGRIKDIQTYQRAHAADLRKKSKAESIKEFRLKKAKAKKRKK